VSKAFRLQKVLEARRSAETRRQQELAAANQVLNRERAILERMRAEGESLRAEALAMPTGQLDVRVQVALRAILDRVTEAARRQEEAVTHCERRAGERRAALVNAAIDRKVLENLEARAAEAWRREQDAQEQIETDEIARQSFVRDREGSPAAQRPGRAREERV